MEILFLLRTPFLFGLNVESNFLPARIEKKRKKINLRLRKQSIIRKREPQSSLRKKHRG